MKFKDSNLTATVQCKLEFVSGVYVSKPNSCHIWCCEVVVLVYVSYVFRTSSAFTGRCCLVLLEHLALFFFFICYL